MWYGTFFWSAGEKKIRAGCKTGHAPASGTPSKDMARVCLIRGVLLCVVGAARVFSRVSGKRSHLQPTLSDCVLSRHVGMEGSCVVFCFCCQEEEWRKSRDGGRTLILCNGSTQTGNCARVCGSGVRVSTPANAVSGLGSTRALQRAHAGGSYLRPQCSWARLDRCVRLDESKISGKNLGITRNVPCARHVKAAMVPGAAVEQ